MNRNCDCCFQCPDSPPFVPTVGHLLQFHSDGGLREDGKAAASFTAMELRRGSGGSLSRRLLHAEGVLITDGCSSASMAEHIALAMAMRFAANLTQQFSLPLKMVFDMHEICFAR